MKHKPLLLIFLTVFIVACGAAGQAVQVTEAPGRTETLNWTSTPDATPTRHPTRTKAPDAAATVESEQFSEMMLTYFDDKFLQTVDGEYYPLEDYVDNLAHRGYFSWSTYDVNIRNFVLHTNVRMSTANEPSSSTGCGIVFRTIGDFKESVFIQQNGEIFYGAGDTNYHSGYYGKVSNPAEFEMVLMVNEKSYRVFVDGKQALTGETILDPSRGGIGFAVQSGSDEDFGSQCNFTNNDLWALKKK